jgi:hypothetical protein
VIETDKQRIDYLVLQRFPAARALSFPPSLNARGPSRDFSELREMVKAYRSELAALASEELVARCADARKQEAEANRLKAELEEQARFFNQPWTDADFTHWSKAAHWTLDEAIALSFGKAPESVRWEKVQSLLNVSAFAFQYGRRRDLALRALQWKQLFDPVLPGIFLAWAKRTDITVPVALEAAVTSRGISVADWRSLYEELAATLEKERGEWLALSRNQSELIDQLHTRLAEMPPAQGLPEKPLGARERESLLKLVIGMAVGGYAYDPRSTRSAQYAAIADDLERCGIHLDVDTVRKWVREAAGSLPRE